MREAGSALLTVMMPIFVRGVALIVLLLTALAHAAYSRSQILAKEAADRFPFGWDVMTAVHTLP